MSTKDLPFSIDCGTQSLRAIVVDLNGALPIYHRLRDVTNYPEHPETI